MPVPSSRPTVLVLVLLAFVLSGCFDDVPEVECAWMLPASDQDRVPSAAGFTVRINITGVFDAEELPAVHFFSDVEASGSTYENGRIFESGIAFDGEDCAAGCAAGGRIEVPLTPGTHEITAQALTPRGSVACEVGTTLNLNYPPTVSEVTLSPSSPAVQDDVTYSWVGSDNEDDPVSVSNLWVGPDGQELVGDTLTSIQTQTGEQWSLVVFPRDSFDDGPLHSTELLIGNTPPTDAEVTISPDPGRSAAHLRCATSDLSGLDPDSGQELSVGWSWTVDGADAGVSGDTVSPDLISADEVWTCTAVISDGQDSSPGASASTTVIAALSSPADLNLDDEGGIEGVSGAQYIGSVGSAGSPGDINGDGLADFVVTANDEVCTLFCEGQSHAYLFLGGANEPTSLADADADLLIPAGFKVLAPWPVGDINGDGIDELLLPFEDGAGASTGPYGSGFYLVHGSPDGWSGDLDVTTLGSRIINPIGEKIGAIPCPIGDIDGDGYVDLAIASPLANLASGRLYVVFGHPGNWPDDIFISDLSPGFQIVGAGSAQTMATACAGPIDVDDNGYPDIVVGAAGAAAQQQGRVLVYLMDGSRLTGSHVSATADHIIDGDPNGLGGFGLSLANLGDFDGDGRGDFAVFSLGPVNVNPNNPSSTWDGGTAYIVSTGHSSFVGNLTHTDIPYRIEGGSDLGFCGHMTGVDLNGDGLGDLVCGDIRPGAASFIGEQSGVRVFLGTGDPIAAVGTHSDADLVLFAGSDDDFAGLLVAGLEDRNGDGYSEVLVGAPGWAGALPDMGIVYLVDLAE